MGGGGVFRAAAKVAGATVANSGFRSVAAEHPVYAAARNVARPVSVSGISSTSQDVKSGVVTASHGVSSDVSHVQKMVSDFDDWEMAGGEEEMMVNPGQPLPRLVFGGAPSLQEATEATSDLKDALEKYCITNFSCNLLCYCFFSSACNLYCLSIRYLLLVFMRSIVFCLCFYNHKTASILYSKSPLQGSVINYVLEH